MYNSKLLNCIHQILFVIIIIVFSCKAIPKLTILPNQPVINFPTGKTLALSCVGYPEDPTFFNEFKWYDHIGELIEHPSNDEKRLIIYNPSTADSGLYRCEAIFQNTKKLNATVQINFYKEITWDDCNTNQDLIYGKVSQKIICKVSSQPGPEVFYTKDGHIIGENDPSYSISNDGLEIKHNVNETNAGEYVVTALIKNQGSLEYRNINVRVIRPPEVLSFEFNGTIYDIDTSLKINEGERVEIICRANGSPLPIYSWIDAKMRNLIDIPGFLVDKINGILIIEKVEKNDILMSLNCTVTNAAGEDTRTLKIQVNTKPKIIEFKNVSFTVNTENIWECKVRGDPPPSISIKKWNSNQIIKGKYELASLKDGDIILKIKKTISRDDNGLYTCEAINEAGNTLQIGYIEVMFPPDLSKTKNNLKTWGNDVINLTCVAESIPNATYFWNFNGQILNEYDIERYDINGISYLLIPSNPIYYGLYNCTAINPLGENSTIIRLTEAFPPSSPILKNLVIFPTFVEMEFVKQIEDDELPLKNILIKYWKLGEDENEAKIVTKPMDDGTIEPVIYIIDKLVPKGVYFMRFAAENDVGVGDYSQIKTFKTPLEKRPESPQILLEDIKKEYYEQYGYIKCGEKERPSIRWSQANDNGRIINWYIIEYYQVKREGDNWIKDGEKITEKVRAKDQLEYFFPNLRSNAFYKVEIRSENVMGVSKVPGHIVFLTPKDPLDESEEERNISNIARSIINALIILAIVLVILDLFFSIRYKIGITYFLTNLICCSSRKYKHKAISMSEN